MIENTSGTPELPEAPYVHHKDQAEKLLLGPPEAPVFLKASPETGAAQLTGVIEHIGVGDIIPVHRLENEEDLIFFHTGEGEFKPGEREVRAAAGTVGLVPEGTWHRFETPPSRMIWSCWRFSAPGCGLLP